MTPPSETAPTVEDVERAAAFVDMTTTRETLRQQMEALDELIEVRQAALLPVLKDCGAVVIPVQGGEYTVRADKDEEGEFISVSLARTEEAPS